MNESLLPSSSETRINTQLADRLFSIYSLVLILVGTPCNLLCCIIYFQKGNRTNSIKTIFGYLAILDTIVLYTFNLNYVFREFNIDYRLIYLNATGSTSSSSSTAEFFQKGNIHFFINKQNLEEYSLFICRSLSYLAFSTLQTASWVLAFGSLNRYLLISRSTPFEFICKRRYTVIICICITCSFFLANMHILWMNGYRSSTGVIKCYENRSYSTYILWYQRVHLCIYSALPSIILFILNTLLMRLIFASKKRLNDHKRTVLFSGNATLPESRQNQFLLKRLSVASSSRINRDNPRRSLNRHSRKLTLSLIFITLSYFILTFPSTVIFSFIRSYIEPARLRRTVSLFFTNLSTTTHAIRFFIYFSCSTDFRNDFYQLFSFVFAARFQFLKSKQRNNVEAPRQSPIQATERSVIPIWMKKENREHSLKSH